MNLQEMLLSMDACTEAVEYARGYGNDLRSAWEQCEDPKFLCRLYEKLRLPVPLKLRSCEELRARVTWEMVREAALEYGWDEDGVS